MNKPPVTDKRGRPRVQTEFKDKSLTRQSDANEADIKFIMSKFAATGQVQLNEAQGLYLDISEFTDFADATRQLKVAEEHFMRLPSKVREIFDHDVGTWLDTAHDKDKRDALVAAGYLDPLPTPDVPAPPPAAAAAAGDTQPAADVPPAG